MELQLRPYQRECVDAIWNHVRASNKPAVAVLPTGAGKSLVIAQIVKDAIGWNGRVLVLQHVKELVEQNANQIARLAPEAPMGIYSAGLGSRDLGYQVTVAGIQSVYNKAEAVGPMDIIIVDEAHRIPADGEGQYRTFLDAALKINPNARLLGLTATAFRLQSGFIYGKDQLFSDSCFEVGVRKLIVDGYLSPLKSKTTTEASDVSQVQVRGGEFIQSELQAAMLEDSERINRAVIEIGMKAQGRRSIIVFCAGVDHAKCVAGLLRELDLGEVREIYSETSDEERAASIRGFRDGSVRFLVNVDVLTTGFDAPGVDCVSVLRPTMSPGLHYQMIGRGLRLAPGKTDCLVLDFGGNLLRHGPIDRMLVGAAATAGERPQVGPWKECPECLEVAPRTAGVCLDCGYQFPKREPRGIGHGTSSDAREALAEPETVLSVGYSLHTKKDAPEGHPPTLRVTYDVGLMQQPSEWVCFEHQGFARTKAESWWRARSNEPVPKTVIEALEAIETKGILEPAKIILAAEGKYLKVVKVVDLKEKVKDEGPREDIPF